MLLIYMISLALNRPFVFLWKRPDPKKSLQKCFTFLSRICAVHWGCTDQLRFGIMIRLPDSHGSGIFSISPTFSLCIGCTFSSIATMARRNARRGRRLWVGHSWRENISSEASWELALANPKIARHLQPKTKKRVDTFCWTFFS